MVGRGERSEQLLSAGQRAYQQRGRRQSEIHRLTGQPVQPAHDVEWLQDTALLENICTDPAPKKPRKAEESHNSSAATCASCLNIAAHFSSYHDHALNQAVEVVPRAQRTPRR